MAETFLINAGRIICVTNGTRNEGVFSTFYDVAARGPNEGFYSGNQRS